MSCWKVFKTSKMNSKHDTNFNLFLYDIIFHVTIMVTHLVSIFYNLNQTYLIEIYMWFLCDLVILNFLQFGPKFKMALIPPFWAVGTQHLTFFYFSLRDIIYLKSKWFQKLAFKILHVICNMLIYIYKIYIYTYIIYVLYIYTYKYIYNKNSTRCT